jgi:amidohydrolase
MGLGLVICRSVERKSVVVATVERLRGDIDEIMPVVIADRRQFHEYPELGFQEFETARAVVDRLRAMGVEDIRTGIAVTGVTGLIHGGKGPGRVVLLRADMDALPIQEENEVESAPSSCSSSQLRRVVAARR